MSAIAPPSTSVNISRRAVAPRAKRDSLQGGSTFATYALLVLGSLAFLVPFYFILNGSLKTQEAVQAGDFIRPPASVSSIQWSNYPLALSKDKMNFRPALANTVVITTCCVVGQVISCSLVGFGFARFRFRGKSTLFMVMLSTMMLPAQVTMIPVFILFKSLHLIDSFWPLIIPAWLASPFFVFMFGNFSARFPRSLLKRQESTGRAMRGSTHRSCCR